MTPGTLDLPKSFDLLSVDEKKQFLISYEQMMDEALLALRVFYENVKGIGNAEFKTEVVEGLNEMLNEFERDIIKIREMKNK